MEPDDMDNASMTLDAWLRSGWEGNDDEEDSETNPNNGGK